MSGGTDVTVHEGRPPVPPPEGMTAVAERTQRRQAASQMLAVADQVFDLADLTDEQFEKELARMQTRLTRVKRIVETRLIEDVHYGIPKDKDGKKVPGIRKPFLYQAGGEELRNIYRISLKVVESTVASTEEYVSVTVSVVASSSPGRLLCTRTGVCNTKEKRFQKYSGGWIYKDAREAEHGCYTMAEKRAGVLATREATGASALFAAPEELDNALEAEEPEECTPEERKEFFAAAKKVGIKTAGEMEDFVKATLGCEKFFQPDLPKLRAALETYKANARGPLAGSGKDVFAEEPKA